MHPDDERYTHLVGRTAIVPLVEREVPVIADEYVKMDFGTGVLKITPGHDPNDFEIGRRHGLAELSAIGFDGRMTELAGEFAGLPAAEARQKVRDALFDQQLLAGEHDYEHEVGHCDRTGDRVEPLISLQWFMRMDELAAPANAAVRSGRVRFHPKTQENTYFSWMDNLRPWCVSRQLWWGHQIPVWYCPDGHATVELEPTGGLRRVRQDRAGARPRRAGHLVLVGAVAVCHHRLAATTTPGWSSFYPGHVLSTGRDIINLWVARMLMMGIEFMGDIPFSDVLIHSTIQAPDGRRMSKSLGTGIDPLELVDRYGADATRYGLLKMSSTQDVRFDEGAIREGAALANKLWNASRFVINQPAAGRAPAARAGIAGGGPVDRLAARRGARGRAAAGRPVRLLGRHQDAVRVHLERVLRLVHRAVQAAPVRRGRGRPRAGAGGAAVDAGRHPAHGPPDHAVRDRGHLGPPAGRAGAAHAGRLPGPRPGPARRRRDGCHG